MCSAVNNQHDHKCKPSQDLFLQPIIVSFVFHYTTYIKYVYLSFYLPLGLSQKEPNQKQSVRYSTKALLKYFIKNIGDIPCIL